MQNIAEVGVTKYWVNSTVDIQYQMLFYLFQMLVCRSQKLSINYKTYLLYAKKFYEPSQLFLFELTSCGYFIKFIQICR